MPLLLIWVGSFLSEGSCLLMKLTFAWWASPSFISFSRKVSVSCVSVGCVLGMLGLVRVRFRALCGCCGAWGGCGCTMACFLGRVLCVCWWDVVGNGVGAGRGGVVWIGGAGVGARAQAWADILSASRSSSSSSSSPGLGCAVRVVGCSVVG